MTKYPYFVTDAFDRRVITRIIEKYGFEPMDAIRAFLTSETHALLEDAELGLGNYPYDALFDMWECERVTGDPRNSIYIRGE